MDSVGPTERPQKKVKTFHSSLSNALADVSTNITTSMIAHPGSTVIESDRNDKEASCGIIRFVNDEASTFSGILKKRYTDFLVNEILPSGEVVHLTQLKPPKNANLERQNEGWSNDSQAPRQRALGHSPALMNTGLDGVNESKVADENVLASSAKDSTRNVIKTDADQLTCVKPNAQESELKLETIANGGQESIKVNETSLKAKEQNPHSDERRVVQSENVKSATQGEDVTTQVANSTPHKSKDDPTIPEVPSTETPERMPAIPPISQDSFNSSNDPLAHHFELPPQKAVEPSHQSSPVREDIKAREQTGHTRFKAHVRLVNGEWKELTEDEETQLKIQQDEERAEKKANGGDQATISKGVVYGENSMPAPRANGVAMWNAYAGINQEERLDWSQEDQSTLEIYFPRDVIDNLRSLYNRILQSPDQPPKKYGSVKSPRISREARKQIHGDLRRIFQGKLDSETDADGCIIIAATPRQSSFPGRQQKDTRSQQANRNGKNGKPAPKGRQVWEDRGGEYLHFTLYKENKDTMECVSWLMRQLKNKPRDFHFAGTKDRRAVTTQRVCVYRIHLDRLFTAGKTLRNGALGNFEYQQDKLQLGDLAGNEFVITLRECQFEGFDSQGESADTTTATKVVADSVSSLNKDGFLNYYGLQRFGTFGFGTDAVGIALLRGDYNGAVNGILSFNPACLEPDAENAPPSESISRDDRARAQGINHFMQTGDLKRALDRIPRKFSAETTILRHLSHPGHQNDFLGALQMIQRNQRLMYVHAYQSLIWNHAASERWRLYGNRVVEGDLVIITKEDQDPSPNIPGVDADGEVVVQAADDDRAVDLDDIFTRARPLSQAEAESGKYSIFDIVLPTPGFDVVYPSNEIGAFYASFMASERGGGLDPNDMRRPYKDFSLSGSYRNLVALPLKPATFELRTYRNEDEQFVETDLEKLRKASPREENKPRGQARVEPAQLEKPSSAAAADASPQSIKPEAYVPLATGGVSLNPTATPFIPTTRYADSIPLDSGGVDISNHPRVQGTGTNRSSPRIEQGENQQGDGGEIVAVVEKEEKEKIAVIVRMQLGSSTYATMALREVMRGGVRNWKGEFGGGR